MGALALPVVIGVSSLVAEFGLALITKSNIQRTADLAAYAGALAYDKNKSLQEMQATAISVASLNGVAPRNIIVSLVNSPRDLSTKAVSVTINVDQTLFLTKVVNFRTDITISSASVAEVSSAGTLGCMLALSPAETGISLGGGTQITAPNCAVASNSAIALPCGTKIKTIGASYYSAAEPSICVSQPNLVTAAGMKISPTRQLTADPLAGSPAIASANARFKTLTALLAPTVPTMPSGVDIEFGWDQEATKRQASAIGCTASWSQPLWTLDCGSRTNVDVRNLTVRGDINVDFAVNGSASVTYNFSGSISNTGSQMRFGPGTYNIAKGIKTGGSTTTTFKAGTFRIGASDTGCDGNAKTSICNTSRLTFDGPSTFDIAAGFVNTGKSSLTLGSGKTNSFRIGAASNGDAITIRGGSKTVMADATIFEIVGNVNGDGGSSCLVMPKASEHDIDGNFVGAGSIYLGAGTYTINGYFALGLNGGSGGTACNGTTSVTGESVTIILSGKQTPTSGSCNGYAFCIAAGYSGVRLIAPTSGTMANLAVIGPQDTARKGGALLTEGGANGVISGAFYFPNGQFRMSGGANASGLGPGQCFHPIASHITLAGGASEVSECVSGASSGTHKIAIVR